MLLSKRVKVLAKIIGLVKRKKKNKRQDQNNNILEVTKNKRQLNATWAGVWSKRRPILEYWQDANQVHS